MSARRARVRAYTKALGQARTFDIFLEGTREGPHVTFEAILVETRSGEPHEVRVPLSTLVDALRALTKLSSPR